MVGPGQGFGLTIMYTSASGLTWRRTGTWEAVDSAMGRNWLEKNNLTMERRFVSDLRVKVLYHRSSGDWCVVLQLVRPWRLLRFFRP